MIDRSSSGILKSVEDNTGMISVQLKEFAGKRISMKMEKKELEEKVASLKLALRKVAKGNAERSSTLERYQSRERDLSRSFQAKREQYFVKLKEIQKLRGEIKQLETDKEALNKLKGDLRE